MAEAYQHITEDNPDAKEIWGNETERKQKFDAMTPDKFASWIITLNAKLRGKNPALHNFDGEGVVVGDEDMVGEESVHIEHQPPDQEDKQELLTFVLQSAQKLSNIQDVALLVSAGINQIHPFRDKNGTVSRLIYANLSAGSEFVKKHMKEIGEDRTSIDIGSFIPNRFLLKIAHVRLGEDASDRDIRAEAVRVLCDAFSDSSIKMTNDDIPLRSFKIGEGKDISLQDYLRLATRNLVTGDLFVTRFGKKGGEELKKKEGRFEKEW